MLFSRIAPKRVQSSLLGTFPNFQAASDCIDAMLRRNGALRAVNGHLKVHHYGHLKVHHFKSGF